MRGSVLIIDDEPSICTSLEFALEDDYYVRSATNVVDGFHILEENAVDLCLLDLRIGRENGIDVLKRIKAFDKNIVVIMITAYGSISSSVEALQEGAYSYLTKPLNIDELQSVLERSFQYAKLHRQVDYLTNELDKKYSQEGFLARSEAMHHVFKMIDKVKQVNTNVLITGESGTGKELAARSLHFSGSRQREHFEVVNCAAIPEQLLESELFGHEKGAFTGAAHAKVGKFEEAEGGTIFLDEIGDMSLQVQVKLLRVLQTKEIVRLGSNQTIHLDVRVIAATNKDLKKEVQAGRFREDLYFRLNVIELHLPPLRERKDDIPLLARYFIQVLNEELNSSIQGMTKRAKQYLENYPFPGNIRELRNIIESSMVIAEGECIDTDDLPRTLTAADGEKDAESVAGTAGQSLKKVEKEHIKQTLKEFNGHRKQTAEVLGISERGLRDKIKLYDLSD
ncbi:sigma-54-dependent Fis family transcriptional regulator [Salibacterium salarium]|uniref:Sigma-54-dependent Fis family transcriptional regulator n=1 Tax=Salibacterium salarium TaxID=284579 RepID=A0A428N6C0_9BACI|nr:sigma-54 dependent transcriptional regulator [Salibacterium salarium]RSL33906.1 sigma-54-dependent Fis family transcriptional regulator [Salibacterium salarium]